MRQNLKRRRVLSIGIILFAVVFLCVDIFFWPMLPQTLRAVMLGLDQTNTTPVTGLIGEVTPWCGGIDPGENELRRYANNPKPLSSKKVFLRQGSYNTFSPIVAVIKSGSDGKFVVNLPSGSYCPLQYTFLPVPCKEFRRVTDTDIYDAPLQYNGFKIENENIGYLVFFFGKSCPPGPPRP